MAEILYGRNAARECLRARRRHIHEVLLADNLKSSVSVDEILVLAQQSRIPVKTIPRHNLDQLARGHQGVALKTGRYPTVEIGDILRRAAKLDEPPFLIAFDHLEDPNNVGAILRTAEVVGVHGVLLPRMRAVGVTPAVVNVSAGAVEHMWIAEVSSLAQALEKLKEKQVWVVGLDYVPQAVPYDQANLAGAIVLVIGSEGKGLSRLVHQTCDFLVKLPMRGRVEALNASVAGGLVLYEAWRAREFAGKKNT